MPKESRARKRERRKYERAYATQPKYKMKGERRDDAIQDLTDLPAERISLLDVSCGRGEILEIAEQELGFKLVRGTEIVEQLIDGERVVRAWAHELPFDDDAFE